MKIAVCYDSFELRGGGERTTLLLAKHLNADLYTTFIKWGGTYSKEGLFHGINFYEIAPWIPSINIVKHEFMAKTFSNLNLFDSYDIVILSNAWAAYAAILNKSNLYYCFSPPRVFYDLYYSIRSRQTVPFKLVLDVWRNWRMPKDQILVKQHVKKIISISKVVADRVKRYYDRESEIIYPPVDTKQLKFKDYEDFFLVVQILRPEKRTSLIIEAFKHIKDKKLFIVGDGPEKKKLELQSKHYKNIQFLNPQLERDEIIDLYSRCLGTIYIPKNEDFGLIPVESMAAGKPCIGVNEGGLLETLINNKTGFLINPTVKNLIKYIKFLTPEKAEKMKKACINQAKKFDESIFYRKFDNIIRETVKSF
jgi:glycosyltransferase involved in cell wall biosynthesis